MIEYGQENFSEYVVDFACAKLAIGQKIALITLVGIQGSAPRSLGAQMVVSENAERAGYLLAGCFEKAVQDEALLCIEAGVSRLVSYGKGSNYLDIQLPCDSRVDLYFDTQITLEILMAIDTDYQARRTSYLLLENTPNHGNFKMAQHRNHLSEMMENCFWVTYSPKIRVIILGTGAVAVQLAKIAQLSNFEVICDRTDLEIDQIYQSDNIIAQHFTNVEDIMIDCYSAVVTVFHDHEQEIKFLPIILASDAFYIGAMGSDTTHTRRVDRLRSCNIEGTDIARINAPAGLFRSGKSASDIAISILAQIITMQPK